jgi:hypothetical protein
VGSPHTYDVCDRCGDPIVNLNNAGTWTHTQTDAVKNGIPATDCFRPSVRIAVASKNGQTTASHGKAVKDNTKRRDQ